MTDLGVVAILVLLEALLSADNALILAIMVRHLPPEQQKKALLYGLGGAFVFRFIAILFAVVVLQLWWLQAIGAAYLVAIVIKHFVGIGGNKDIKAKTLGFWPTVVSVEIADMAFAIDSVLAGVAMVKGPSKIWVVYLGAIVGIFLLRMAAGVFIKLLKSYPFLDHVAYLLVGWVGVKLSFLAAHNYSIAKQMPERIEELSPIIFWVVMIAIGGIGTFIATRHRSTEASVE